MNYDITKEKSGFFNRTLEEANVGDTLVYHIGAYAKGPHKADAIKAYDGGLCLLYQRKVDDGKFAYTACKINKGKKK
jgi:hypothetical protein